MLTPDQDQGRRDDLWSWLYILAELVNGGLPWRSGGEGGAESDRERGSPAAMLQHKLRCIEDPALLTPAIPLPGRNNSNNSNDALWCTAAR